MTKTGPRRLQRSRASPCLANAKGHESQAAQSDRDGEPPRQHGRPMAFRVPWSRSLVSHSAKAPSAISRSPPMRLWGHG
jgi:hypothetical protein